MKAQKVLYILVLTVLMSFVGMTTSGLAEDINGIGVNIPHVTFFNEPTTNHHQILPDEKVIEVVNQMLSGDFFQYTKLPIEQQQQVFDYIKYWEIYSVDINQSDLQIPIIATGYYTLGLPDCGGYWTSHWEFEAIEQRDSRQGLNYEVGPNCCMEAPGDDCGTDHDDYMLSFYFGRHNENLATLRGKLKWTSTNSWVKALLGTLSARVYEQYPGGGADNYDIKVCIDDYFKPYFQTFRLRKY